MTYSGQIEVTNIACECGAKVIIEEKYPNCGKYRESILKFDDPKNNILLASCITVGECLCGGNIVKYINDNDAIATCEKCFKRYKVILRGIED